MTNKGYLILTIVITLILAALISRNGSFALMAIPFLVFLGAGAASFPGKIDVAVSRELNPLRSKHGEDITMLLTIENKGGSIPRLQLIEPELPKMTLVDGSLEHCFALSSGERIQFSYCFRTTRGRYAWEVARLIASDPFGLFEQTLDVKAEAHALVWPDRLKLHHPRFHPRPTIRTAGPNLSRLPGSGIDFWGIREYHPGDSLRLINWRLAARHPRSFFTKVHEREEMADIGILLDARKAANHCNGSDGLFEYSIQAAASLAGYFLSVGNRVSMLVLNDRLTRVFPGYGKHQLVKILDQLAGCSPGERVSFETLRYLPVKLFPSHSVIVLISPLLPDDFNIIVRLQAEGYQILLVSPNPVQWTAMNPSGSPYDSIAVRTAYIERAILLKRIQGKGVKIVDWQVNQSLIQALRAASIWKM